MGRNGSWQQREHPTGSRDMFKQNDEAFRQVVAALQSDENQLKQLSPLALAYLGDAVFELAVRTRIAATHPGRVRDLHERASNWVRAESQARMMHYLMDQLLEDEAAVVKRARNTKSSVPRNARVSDYRYSTAFEALLGYLYVSGNFDRLGYLIEAALAFAGDG